MALPDASVVYGAFPMVLAGQRETVGALGQLDAAVVQCAVMWETRRAQAAALGYVKHAKVASAGHSMWVEEIEFSREGAQTGTADVQLIGLLDSGDKRRRTMQNAGRQVAIGPYEKVILVTTTDENAEDPEAGEVDAVRRIPKLDEDGEVVYKSITTASGNGERWNINQPLVAITDRYFVTAKPSQVLGGTVLVPANAPSITEVNWASSGAPLRFQHPNGWVLSNRSIEEFFRVDDSNGLWGVQDDFEYFPTHLPD